MNDFRADSKNPTSMLATHSVGGVRQGDGARSKPGSLPVPLPQGSQGSSAPLGCGSQSGQPEGLSFLDSYKNNCNRFCGNWSVSGKIKENNKDYIHVARLGCKRWSCPICGPKRAKKLRFAIIQKATEGKLQRFLTLTLDPRNCTAEDSGEYLKNTWRKFRVSLKRQCGDTIDYILISENQKSGYAHLHILIDRYISQKWLQTAWQCVGGGKFVNIKYVDIHRIAAYLSKYLTKDMFLNQFKRGARRYTTSRTIKLFEKAIKGQWQLIKNSIDNLLPANFSATYEEKYDENGIKIWFRYESI